MKRKLVVTIRLNELENDSSAAVGDLLEFAGRELTAFRDTALQEEGVEKVLFDLTNNAGKAVGSVSYLTDPISLEKLMKVPGDKA